MIPLEFADSPYVQNYHLIQSCFLFLLHIGAQKETGTGEEATGITSA